MKQPRRGAARRQLRRARAARPRAHYGGLTLDRARGADASASRDELGLDVAFSQTNHEGEFCEELHRAGERADGLVLNPGAWTHYSWAIRDALEVAGLPAVEVHLSAVDEREEWRRAVGDPRPLHRLRAGQGRRGLPRGARDCCAEALRPMSPRRPRWPTLLAERELDCLLVTDLVNVRYLTGFTGTNGACVVTPRRAPVPHRLPLRRAGRARRCRASSAWQPGREHARRPGRAAARPRRLRRRARERARAPAARREGAPRASSWCPPAGLVEGLRAVKDARGAERDARRGASSPTPPTSELRERGLAGRTEREVARSARARSCEDARRRGPSFPPIVAAGAHGALPHAEPRDVEIPRGTLVVVDLGARVDGYCSDCTRTFATGPLDDEAREVYELVRRAQAGGARGGARRGATAARSTPWRARLIEAAGHGERLRPRARPRRRASRCTRGRGWRSTAEGALAAGQRRDGRAGRLPAGRVRRPDRGPGGRGRGRLARS